MVNPFATMLSVIKSMLHMIIPDLSIRSSSLELNPRKDESDPILPRVQHGGY